MPIMFSFFSKFVVYFFYLFGIFFTNSFNLIAQFVNDKVAKGLQAPSFLGVQGEDGNFCVTVGAADDTLPPEFRGNTVSKSGDRKSGDSILIKFISEFI